MSGGSVSAASRTFPHRFRHFAAIDWSGAVGERQRGIAVALVSGAGEAPQLVRPGHIWSRAEVLHWLLTDLPPDTLVGMDLGAALPFLGGLFTWLTETLGSAMTGLLLGAVIVGILHLLPRKHAAPSGAH